MYLNDFFHYFKYLYNNCHSGKYRYKIDGYTGTKKNKIEVTNEKQLYDGYVHHVYIYDLSQRQPFCINADSGKWQ